MLNRRILHDCERVHLRGLDFRGLILIEFLAGLAILSSMLFPPTARFEYP